MLNDGSMAWEAKDFLVQQDRCEVVTIDGKDYPGKGGTGKQVRTVYINIGETVAVCVFVTVAYMVVLKHWDSTSVFQGHTTTKPDTEMNKTQQKQKKRDPSENETVKPDNRANKKPRKEELWYISPSWLIATASLISPLITLVLWTHSMNVGMLHLCQHKAVLART